MTLLTASPMNIEIRRVNAEASAPATETRATIFLSLFRYLVAKRRGENSENIFLRFISNSFPLFYVVPISNYNINFGRAQTIDTLAELCLLPVLLLNVAETKLFLYDLSSSRN